MEATKESEIQDDYWVNHGIAVEVPPTNRTDKTEAPDFNHPEIESLYVHDIRIPTRDLEAILKLPRKTLIEDLELVLDDSIERFNYFDLRAKDNYIDGEFLAVVHSMFLLAELESKSSLPKIFDVLSQGSDYLELFIGEFLTEELWSLIFKLGKDDLDSLTAFMLRPGIYLFSKASVVIAVEHIAYYYPERREEVLEWFENILTQYLDLSPDDNIVDAEETGFSVISIMNLGGQRLLPLIKQLFEKGYIFKGVCGDFVEVEREIKSAEMIDRKRESMDIFSQYQNILNTWSGYQEKETASKFLENNEKYYSSFGTKPVVKEKKIGRNEACPCGSGKKYKKCCLE